MHLNREENIDRRWIASRIDEDHQKLDRIFASLESTLRAMAERDPSLAQDPDLLEDARDDLSFALEEMLEHFGMEEEAMFTLIRDALPEFAPALAALEEGHESMCQKTSRLRKMVAAARMSEETTLDIDAALDIVGETTRMLAKHNRQEVKLFYEVFQRLDEQGQQRLIHAIQNH
ncbi:MAG: hemerythrin domain-containing protein [Myxococcota bacterium]